MANKFVEGLAFGGGFTVSFLAISYIAAFFIMPTLMSERFSAESTAIEPDQSLNTEKAGPAFHELTVEDQIRQASVIALLRYEQTSDGKVKAVFSEFLKRQPTAKIHYDLGDEYPPASHYPHKDVSRGDGVIVFFVGSPADMRMSVPYSNGRIHGLGDMPLELFRKKCSGKDA